MNHRQKGMATVEFAIVAVAFFLIFLGSIEVARALFVWNTIGEATRRGARTAVVCPANHSGIAEVAVFERPLGGAVLNGLTTGHVNVAYLNAAGGPAAGPIDTEFVSVSIAGYVHSFLLPSLIPGLPIRTAWELPPFTTTLPVESMGLIPDTFTFECFGS